MMLAALHAAHRAALDSVLERTAGYTLYEVLILSDVASAGPSTSGDLADRIGLGRGRVSGMLERMAAFGVVRSRHGSGGRRTWDLTDDGKEAVEVIRLAMPGIESDILAELGTYDLTSLRDVLRRMGEAVAREPEVAERQAAAGDLRSTAAP